MKKILVTGFEPFGDQILNPAEKLSRHLADEIPSVTSLILPVVFTLAAEELLKFYTSQGLFAAVVMLGQAGGRDKICLERVAHNWMENKSADSKNPLIPAGKISANHSDAVMTSLPVEKIRDQINALVPGNPASVSLSAGSYVCNDLYFRILNHSSFAGVPALFVHVPYLPEQKLPTPQTPVMDFATQATVLSHLIQILS